MSKSKKKPSKVTKTIRAPRSKSFEWEGFAFQWHQHKRAFRIMSRVAGFVGHVRGTADDAKRAAVAFQTKELIAAVDRACADIDKMRDCLNEHQSTLSAHLVAVSKLLAATGSRPKFDVDIVEADSFDDDE